MHAPQTRRYRATESKYSYYLGLVKKGLMTWATFKRVTSLAASAYGYAGANDPWWNFEAYLPTV